MNKPASLRRALEAELPDLKASPDKLKVFIDEGAVDSSGSRSLSFEYRYTLNIIVQDYAQHPDRLMLTILRWLHSNQPDLLDNRDKRRDGFTFEAEILNHAQIDIAIRLQLTERVGVKEEAGRLTVTHLDEPQRDPYAGQHWELSVRDATDGDTAWPTN